MKLKNDRLHVLMDGNWQASNGYFLRKGNATSACPHEEWHPMLMFNSAEGSDLNEQLVLQVNY